MSKKKKKNVVAVDIAISDSLQNFVTGLGEKSKQRNFLGDLAIDDEEFFNMYNNVWLCANYVNKTAKDMLKQGRNIISAEYTGKIKQRHERYEKRFNIQNIMLEALTWGSVYGDSLILAVPEAIDPEVLASPFRESEEIKRFLVFDKKSYDLGETDEDILSENYGNPIYYRITRNSLGRDINIHYSRVFRVMVGKVPFSKKSSKQFGVSDLRSKYQETNSYLATKTSISDLIEESKIDVFKMKDLNKQIAENNERAIIKKISLIQATKSINNAIAIDMEETEWDQKQLSYASLTEIWEKARLDLSGAYDRPMTILFGQSPSGFSDGENDTSNYYDEILSLQEERVRPMLEFLDKFFLIKEGIDDWGFEFNPIEKENKTEEATNFNTLVTALSTLNNDGIISEQKYADELIARDLLKTGWKEEDRKNLIEEDDRGDTEEDYQ